jgi:S-adenosyl-L-methionine hydrolase (adenosine-forming)
MSDAIITLTTDFGTSSPFVGAIKGAILSINPTARLIDLSHDLPPFDIRHAAFFLAESLPHFPPHTIHVVVIDPEVGGTRNALFVSVAGQRIVVPDNGCWTLLAEGRDRPLRVLKLAEPKYWRTPVCPTFHGRDIFGPVAAYLSLGVSPSQLGPPLTTWRELVWPTPNRSARAIVGEIIFVDHFGNLISNIAGHALTSLPPTARVVVSDGIVARKVRTYADAQTGDLISLVSSSGLLEVAVVQGNAATKLGLQVGASLRIEWT